MTQINAVIKAIHVLQTFTPNEPRLSLGEIAKRLEMGKSTVHNLLNTLAQSGFIEKAEDGTYALGAELIALTQAIRINVELRDPAAPRLRRLAEATKESVYLAVFDRMRVLYIYAIESSDRLRARTAVGDRADLHCTAVGKAILSRLPADMINNIIAEVGLPVYTANTITDRARLQAELALTAQRGYAVDCSEHEHNYYCVAAPICDRRGFPIAACSVSGTNPAILGARLPDLASQVMETAQEVARYLGYIPSRAAAAASRPHINGDFSGTPHT